MLPQMRGQSVTQQQYLGLPWTKLCTKVKVADQANGEAQTAPEVNLCLNSAGGV